MNRASPADLRLDCGELDVRRTMRIMRGSMLRFAATMAVLLSAGCGAIGGQVGVAADRMPPFPECQTDEFAFAGETTLAALGLDRTFGGPDSGRVAMVWVTAGPVEQPMPQPVGVPPEKFSAQRMVCVEWPDGSGMAGPIDDSWSPPSSIAAATDEPAAPPVGQLALLVAALVVIGVSVIAFRREG